LAALLIADAAFIAVPTLEPSLMFRGPKPKALFDELLADVFELLLYTVFFASRSMMVSNVLTAGASALVKVAVMVPAEPVIATMVCCASWLTVSMASSIMYSTFAAVKSPVGGGPAA
jgi:hypothetical protein